MPPAPMLRKPEWREKRRPLTAFPNAYGIHKMPQGINNSIGFIY
jgi:hypothetical protein